MPSRSLKLAAPVVAVALCVAGGIAWAVPPGFNTQGRLTDAQGINRDGTGFSVKFTIFDAPTGGTPLWTKTFSNLTVRNGNFQVILGDPSDTPSQTLPAAFAGDARFLEIQVLSGPGIAVPEPPMTPRQQLVSVPYALRSTIADGLTTGWKVVASQNPVEANSVTFAGLKPDRQYRLAYRLVKTEANARLLQRINGDSGPNYKIVNFNFNSQPAAGSTGGNGQSACYFSPSEIRMGGGSMGTHTYGTLPGKGSTVMFEGRGVEENTGNNANLYNIAGYYIGAAPLSSVVIYAEAGRFTGSFQLEELIAPLP